MMGIMRCSREEKDNGKRGIQIERDILPSIPYLVRKRNEHHCVTRPDMKLIGVEKGIGSFSSPLLLPTRWDGQFHIALGNVALFIVHTGLALDGRSNSREGTISPNDQVSINDRRSLIGVCSGGKGKSATLKIQKPGLLIKPNRNSCPLSSIQENVIKRRPGDGVDVLRVKISRKDRMEGGRKIIPRGVMLMSWRTYAPPPKSFLSSSIHKRQNPYLSTNTIGMGISDIFTLSIDVYHPAMHGYSLGDKGGIKARICRLDGL